MTHLERIDYVLVGRLLSAFPEIRANAPVLVGVSGGSDSVALLELLIQARSFVGATGRHTAVYVDHAQHPGTNREAAFVEETADRCGAEFVVAGIVDASQKSEAQLRSQRYAAFEAVASRVGARYIATGHTLDDQIETFLLRLIRGAGRHGLTGIPARRGNIVRPLLGMKREELRGYLQRRGACWLDDPSNATDQYTRNRLRNEVVPAVHRAFGDHALEHLPDLARRLGVEDDFLEAEAARYRSLVLVDEGRAVDLTVLGDVPAALRPRLLRAWLAQMTTKMDCAGGPAPAMISMSQLAALEKLIESLDGSVAIDLAGLRIERTYDRLLARPTGERECPPQSFLYKIDARVRRRFVGPQYDWEILIDPTPDGRPSRACGTRRECIDVKSETLMNPAVLRPAANGDRIDLARHGLRKVRDIMADRRLPRSLREVWPVLACESRVLWVPGFAVAEGLEAGENEQARVRLDWKGAHIGVSRDLP